MSGIAGIWRSGCGRGDLRGRERLSESCEEGGGITHMADFVMPFVARIERDFRTAPGGRLLRAVSRRYVVSG